MADFHLFKNNKLVQTVKDVESIKDGDSFTITMPMSDHDESAPDKVIHPHEVKWSDAHWTVSKEARNYAWQMGEMWKAMQRAAAMQGEYAAPEVKEPRGMIFNEADLEEAPQLEDKSK